MSEERQSKRVVRICPACRRPNKHLVSHLRTHLWNGKVVFENGFWFTPDGRFIKTSATRQDEAALAAALDVIAMYQNCDSPEDEAAEYFGFSRERLMQLVKKRKRAA